MMDIWSEHRYGRIVHADSIDYMPTMDEASVDLVVTSPPYAFSAGERSFSNPKPEDYVDWFLPFGREIFRVLKDTGSLVLNMGSVWNKGSPTTSLYHYETLIALCRKVGFHLAQEMYSYKVNLGSMEWTNVRRIRLKSYIENVFWLSKTEWPKADNRNVLVPYGESMLSTLESSKKKRKGEVVVRPSGRRVLTKYNDNGGGIASNLVATPNTASNDYYHKGCIEKDMIRHDARFPPLFAEFFIRFLTGEGDMVLDPFAGSCTTGEAAEATRRKWICVEKDGKYLPGAMLRFPPKYAKNVDPKGGKYEINKTGYNFFYGKSLPFPGGIPENG